MDAYEELNGKITRLGRSLEQSDTAHRRVREQLRQANSRNVELSTLLEEMIEEFEVYPAESDILDRARQALHRK